MPLQNQLGLPEALVTALTNDPYDSGASDISVTRLIAPPKVTELRRRHQGEIVEDVTERIYALFGQLGHLVLERAGADAGFVEKRFFAERLGWRISGQADLIKDSEGCHLVDYKFTSKFTTADGVKPEWTQQLNLLRWLTKQNGMEVHDLEIVAFYRDWSALQAAKNPSYTQFPAERFPIDVWDDATTEAFLDHRIRLHQAAREMGDDQIPACEMIERWQDPPMWAVKKTAKTNRAVNNGKYTVEEQASEHAARIGGVVEFRPSEPIRCKYFCKVRPFCSFGRTIQMDERRPE